MSRRRSTVDLLEDLARLNPVEGPDPVQSAGDRPVASLPCATSLGSRRGIVLAAAALATAIGISIVVALPLGKDDGGPGGVVATAAAVAAEQPPQAPRMGEYAYRMETWRQRSLPGDLAAAGPDGVTVSGAGANPAAREGVREVWFGPDGRGKIKGDEPPGWPPCSAADVVLAISTYEWCWSQIGGPGGVNELALLPPAIERAIERRLARRDRPLPEYSEFSERIDELAADPSRVEAAVERLADQPPQDLSQAINERDRVSWEDAEGSPSAAAKLRAVADLLANPLATPSLRSALFDYAGGLDGIAAREDVSAPNGGEGASLSIVSGARDQSPILIDDIGPVIREPFKRYERDGYELDLSALRYRTEIIFDPDTSELLGERLELLDAGDPLIGAWLERVGAPQAIYERSFEPIRTVAEIGDRPGAAGGP